MPKSNSNTKISASNTIADDDNVPDATYLESLPLEIFCIVMKSMSIAEIETIADRLTSLRDKANSDTLWEQMIDRDFGQHALCTYHKQLRTVNGISAAKLYYKFLFEGFEAKIKDYMGFLENYSYLTIDQSSLQEQDFIQFDIRLKKTAEQLGKWVALNTESRLLVVKKYYSFYLEAISQLAPVANRSFQFCLPPLAFAIRNRLSLLAISLIALPEVNVNQYSDDGVDDSIILDAMQYDKDETVVNALLERVDLNLFVKNKYGMNPLSSAYSKEVKTKVFYKMLCAAGADGAYKILPLIHTFKLCKKDVFQHMYSLIKNLASIQEKLKILYFSIAKSEGEYCSALSYYFHEVKSPHDIVKKVKTLIVILEASLASQVPLHIKNPEIIWNDLADWAVEEPEDLMWRISNCNYIKHLEEQERSCFDIDGLNTDLDECDDYRTAEAVVADTVCHQTDVSDDDHKFATVLVNAIFANSAKQSIRRFKLENLGIAILSIGVGLAFGLGLGLGAHVHIAASVLSSIISTVLIFAISARYNYYRHMGPDVDSEPVSKHVEHPAISANTTSNNNQLTSATNVTFLPSVNSGSNSPTITGNLSSPSIINSPQVVSNNASQTGALLNAKI